MSSKFILTLGVGMVLALIARQSLPADFVVGFAIGTTGIGAFLWLRENI